MKLPDDVLRDIRYRLVQGLDSRDEIFASMIDNRTEELGDDPEILVALREAIEEAFLAKKTAADSWPTVTDNDRLLAAFAALDAEGILALESPGDTQDDALRRAVAFAAARRALENPVHGYCFFTWNDMARAIEGEGLTLAYGTFEDGSPEPVTTPTPEQKVGGAVVRACVDAGLNAEWTGADEDFIEMPRFTWQRR